MKNIPNATLRQAQGDKVLIPIVMLSLSKHGQR